MNKQELNKLVDHEIQWLAYYGERNSRANLTVNSELYKDLVSIGYTKKIIPLDRRCLCDVLTSNTKITKDTLLENIYSTKEPRDLTKNCLSPLEVYWILYPDERTSVINKLNGK